MFRTARAQQNFTFAAALAGRACWPPRCCLLALAAACRRRRRRSARPRRPRRPRARARSWLYDTEPTSGSRCSATARSPPATASPPTATRAPSCASARPRCAWPAAASSRCAASTTSASNCSCSTAASRCACARRRVARVRARHRRGPLHAAPRRPLPHRPLRRRQRRPRPGTASCASRATTARSTSAPAAAREFWREASATHYSVVRAGSATTFADWVARADRDDERTGAVTRYVSPEMTGVEDLDRYGHWEQPPRVRRRSGTPTTVVARLGAVPLRPLGLGPPLGLDLGRRRAVGLRAVPLRPLGHGRRPLGLGAGPLRRAAGLRAGAGGLDRPRACQRRRAGGGLGAAGPARAVLPALRTARRLLEVGELGAPALVPAATRRAPSPRARSAMPTRLRPGA